MMRNTWSPASWQTKTCAQQPEYPSAKEVASVCARLETLPPLVSEFEIKKLKEQLADAQKGRYFLLQGGDCAESFADCRAESITDKLKILLQMSLILTYGLRKPVIRVGRIAGQYAKPRSSASETQGGIELPSYRGDIVNDVNFTATARQADPERMLSGYHHSALTLNYLRALIDGGFADLQHPESWELDFVKKSPMAQQYLDLAHTIGDAIDYVKTIPGINAANLQQVDFFTSHEALLLPYEAALTRFSEPHQRWYNLSTHLPWIGMRTAHLEGGHVEYMRGIANPVGIKIGPAMTIEWLLPLIQRLNPDNEAGKIILIHRFGQEHIAEKLPPLINAIQKADLPVLWSCDPMHGNTKNTQSGYKTRYFHDILSELQQAFALHHQCGSFLGGIHFEMTGDDVTECIGGATDVREEDLKLGYKSMVDPRLNYEQALEMAMLIVKKAGGLP